MYAADHTFTDAFTQSVTINDMMIVYYKPNTTLSWQVMPFSQQDGTGYTQQTLFTFRNNILYLFYTYSNCGANCQTAVNNLTIPDATYRIIIMPTTTAAAARAAGVSMTSLNAVETYLNAHGGLR